MEDKDTKKKADVGNLWAKKSTSKTSVIEVRKTLDFVIFLVLIVEK